LTVRAQDDAALSAFVRAIIAAAVAALSFIALREYYQGDCLWLQWDPLKDSNNDSNQMLFLVGFGLLFLFSFAWFVTELVRTIGTFVLITDNALGLVLTGVVVATILYAAIGVAVFNFNPMPRNATDDNVQTAVPFTLLAGGTAAGNRQLQPNALR
jgi:hypothetical protein